MLCSLMIYFALLGLGFVAAVLFLGFYNMVRSDRSSLRAQTLMRVRVWGQLAVVGLLALSACWVSQ